MLSYQLEENNGNGAFIEVNKKQQHFLDRIQNEKCLILIERFLMLYYKLPSIINLSSHLVNYKRILEKDN